MSEVIVNTKEKEKVKKISVREILEKHKLEHQEIKRNKLLAPKKIKI